MAARSASSNCRVRPTSSPGGSMTAAALSKTTKFSDTIRARSFRQRVRSPDIHDCSTLLFFRALGLTRMRKSYERYVFARSEKAAARGALRLLHIDMRIHSYAERQTAKRMIWKPQARAADAVLANFGSGPASEDCELYLTDAEHAAADALMAREGISRGFVIVEPDTNRDYFGQLRAWPRDRWLAFVRKMRTAIPRWLSCRSAFPTVSRCPMSSTYAARPTSASRAYCSSGRGYSSAPKVG